MDARAQFKIDKANRTLAKRAQLIVNEQEAEARCDAYYNKRTLELEKLRRLLEDKVVEHPETYDALLAEFNEHMDRLEKANEPQPSANGSALENQKKPEEVAKSLEELNKDAKLLLDAPSKRMESYTRFVKLITSTEKPGKGRTVGDIAKEVFLALIQLPSLPVSGELINLASQQNAHQKILDYVADLRKEKKEQKPMSRVAQHITTEEFIMRRARDEIEKDDEQNRKEKKLEEEKERYTLMVENAKKKIEELEKKKEDLGDIPPELPAAAEDDLGKLQSLERILEESVVDCERAKYTVDYLRTVYEITREKHTIAERSLMLASEESADFHKFTAEKMVFEKKVKDEKKGYENAKKSLKEADQLRCQLKKELETEKKESVVKELESEVALAKEKEEECEVEECEVEIKVNDLKEEIERMGSDESEEKYEATLQLHSYTHELLTSRRSCGKLRLNQLQLQMKISKKKGEARDGEDEMKKKVEEINTELASIATEMRSALEERKKVLGLKSKYMKACEKREKKAKEALAKEQQVSGKRGVKRRRIVGKRVIAENKSDKKDEENEGGKDGDVEMGGVGCGCDDSDDVCDESKEKELQDIYAHNREIFEKYPLQFTKYKQKYQKTHKYYSKYCICKNQKVSGNMFQCIKCKKWYHEKCLLSLNYKIPNSEDPLCPKCS